MRPPDVAPEPDAIKAWERAYQRFETPEQEVNKFVRRLRALRVDQWDRQLQVMELFCGRGNGLTAWRRLGFAEVEGLDLSPDLVSQYHGPAKIHVGDARHLPFEAGSRDVICIQGGLHHLLADDLPLALTEIHRVLREAGRLVLVEPWNTPFLRMVHAACGLAPLRRLWPRLDALATMIELERETYEAWLRAPETILEALQAVIEPMIMRIGWGKLMLVGRRNSWPSSPCPEPPTAACSRPRSRGPSAC